MCACSPPLYPIEGRVVSEELPSKTARFSFLATKDRIAWCLNSVKPTFPNLAPNPIRNGLKYSFLAHSLIFRSIVESIFSTSITNKRAFAVDTSGYHLLASKS